MFAFVIRVVIVWLVVDLKNLFYVHVEVENNKKTNVHIQGLKYSGTVPDLRRVAHSVIPPVKDSEISAAGRG